MNTLIYYKTERVRKIMDSFRSNSIVSQCAWCKKVKQPGGTYAHQEVAYGAVISHGCCPECVAVVMSDLDGSQQH